MTGHSTPMQEPRTADMDLTLAVAKQWAVTMDLETPGDFMAQRFARALLAVVEKEREPAVCRSAGANGEGKCRRWCGLNYCEGSAFAQSADGAGIRISNSYQDVFNAIAAAVKIEAGAIGISVEAFLKAIPRAESIAPSATDRSGWNEAMEEAAAQVSCCFIGSQTKYVGSESTEWRYSRKLEDLIRSLKVGSSDSPASPTVQCPECDVRFDATWDRPSSTRSQK